MKASEPSRKLKQTAPLAPSGAARAGKWKAAVLLASVIAALPLSAASGADDPRAVVERTASAVVSVLGEKDMPAAEKRARIEEIVYASVDFATLSRLVLARNWTRLTEAQRAEFVAEFKRHLSVTYGKNIDSYRNERVAIVGDRAEARGDWTVQSRIVRGGSGDILVDYRLRQKNGRWAIIDIVVEGVSLVSNFRSQFQEIISNQGVAKLLQLLREKNAAGEPLKS